MHPGEEDGMTVVTVSARLLNSTKGFVLNGNKWKTGHTMRYETTPIVILHTLPYSNFPLFEHFIVETLYKFFCTMRARTCDNAAFQVCERQFPREDLQNIRE